MEIKTSRLKNEGFGFWYGAALNVKKCRTHHNANYLHPTRKKIIGDFCYFDFVIFVALANNFSHARYYILPRHFIESNEPLLRNDHKRFSSSTHRLIISDGRKMPSMNSQQLKLIEKIEAYRNQWDLLRKAIT